MKGDAVARMSRSLELANRFIIRELESRAIFGIVPSHGDILYLLFHTDKLQMQEIARKIHRTKPTVTILIQKLVELGYVSREKSHEDNRITYISLTDKGSKLGPIFDEISEKLKEKVYGDFTPAQSILFEEMLHTVYNRFAHIGEEDVEERKMPTE